MVFDEYPDLMYYDLHLRLLFRLRVLHQLARVCSARHVRWGTRDALCYLLVSS
jgi:hypothetical protein